jgi:hypothetical protein
MARVILHYSFPEGADRVRAQLRKRLKSAGLTWDGTAKFDGRNLRAQDVATVLQALSDAVIDGQPANHIWLHINDSD